MPFTSVYLSIDEKITGLIRSDLENSEISTMNPLSREKCEHFGNTAAKLDHTEIVDLLRQLPSWNLVSKDGVDHLEKTFSFKNFRQALEFTVKVGDLADEVDHHPAILTEWGRTTVTWWTHSLNGLQRNDFIMSAKTDSLYE